MNGLPATSSTDRSRAFPAIGWAGLIAGILDITSAFVLSYLKGGGPISVLQGVAAGLLGRESAIRGGLAIAGLGLAIHFFIAFVAASVFYLASRKIAWLTRQVVISGFLYGIAIYLVMYWIVMPLAYPVVHPSLSRDVIAVCVHMFLIGLPIALIVRHFSQSTRPSALDYGSMTLNK
jgi:hypothetical protein